MAGDSEQSRLFTRRAFLIGGVQASLFALLAGRVYYLDVIEGEKYRTLAEENRINLRLLAPRRGQIFDRNGAPLALNQQNFRVVLLPEQIDDLDELLDKLSLYIELTANDRKRIDRDLRNNDSLNAVVVKDNLTRDQMDAIAVRSSSLPGTDIDVGEVRSYPYGAATAHLLGYVGTVSDNDLDKADAEDDDDNDVLSIPGIRIGKNGVEKQYDEPLRGIAGDVEMEVNAHGNVVRELTRNDPDPGADLTLGIDIGLQQFAQQRLMKDEGASAVIMDIHTGEVRMMVSQPGFDPNLFTYGIAQDDWRHLNTDEHAPLMNKIITGVYAPGSTIKPMVAMAGLDSGILDPTEKVYCPGYFDLGDYRFHCWKHDGHGHVDLRGAIAGSCDTYFYTLGHRIGIDRIQAMAHRFGMGQKLGIDLPHERGGFVPSRTWKLATRRQSWQQGETLAAAIGQGYMLASPLQLAVMAARIANGGYAVTPHVARGWSRGGSSPLNQTPVFAAQNWPTMGLEPKHLATVQDAMAAVVNEPIGTAYAARIIKPNLSYAGKTGTAQVRHISESEREEGIIANDALPWKQRDHALFAGYGPVDNPRFSIAVVIEHGGSGGHTAAPIARDLMQECLERDKT
ncbi:MAG: penicillin-binding protein 2 [Alphaproteobacteria bacterium]|nr:penicillin-binding protein 2 [Alphaproteobacteria bacterium]